MKPLYIPLLILTGLLALCDLIAGETLKNK